MTRVDALEQSDVLLGDPIVYVGGRTDVPLDAVAENLADHRRIRGSLLMATEEFLAAVDGSDLTGRGGAHIPAAWKLSAAREAGPGGTVVVNGAEGEPGSGKDASLLQTRPHLVLEGAIAVAKAIQAREIVLWVHESATATRSRLADAVRERAGQIPVPVRLLLAPEGYVGGEASAVISAVRGGPALPQHSRDRARPWGDGPAVLVHNAETHARLGQLALGHAPTATSLVTIAESSGPLDFTRRSVVEVGVDETFAAAVQRAGVQEPAAVLLGGMGGVWVAWRDLAHLRVDPVELKNHGLSLGAGVMHVLPQGRDGLVETVPILERLAAESAKQCGPCIFGLPALTEAMKRRTKRSEYATGVADLVAGRGGCRHPDGAVRMALSALEVFDS